MSTKRYTVVLEKYEDLDDFYTDMEASSGNATIPTRVCECGDRRTISRCTNYNLTDEEAEELRKDSRVLSVQIPPEDMGMLPETCAGPYQNTTQTYSKQWSSNPIAFNNASKNWGIARTIEGVNSPPTWGLPYVQGETIAEEQSKTLTSTSSGKNVDVVIMDHHVNPEHPEFAVNADGSGGSRVNQLNWFSNDFNTIKSGYNSSLRNGATFPSTYVYGSQTWTQSGGNWVYAKPGAYSHHGNHVASSAAGNTHGLARDANIYNISFEAVQWADNHPSIGRDVNGDPNFFLSGPYAVDAIRHWHNNLKTVNPVTGRKNPTIVNMSWVYSNNFFPLAAVQNCKHRGVTTSLVGESNLYKRIFLQTLGYQTFYKIINGEQNEYVYVGNASSTINFDIIDAIRDGVIFVGGSGNYYTRSVIQSDPDWDNSLDYNDGQSFFTHYTMKGTHPASSGDTTDGTKCIAVGAISADEAEYKTKYSVYGKGVDVWAPGEGIMGAYYDNNNPNDGGSPGLPIQQDPRSSNAYVKHMSGTSMACPQVTGLLACHMEQEPGLTQDEAYEYIKQNSVPGMGDDGSGATNYGVNSYGLWESYDRILKYDKKRPESGTVYPHPNHKSRKPDIDSTGVTGQFTKNVGGFAKNYTSGATGVKWPRTRQVVTKPI